VNAIAIRMRGELRRPALTALVAALVVAFAIALSSGAASIGPGRSLGVLLDVIGLGASAAQEHERAVILFVRLPRVLLAIVVGAALAQAGALMQGLFRNPLADPSLVGISAGATLGAATVIVFAGALPFELPTIVHRLLLPVCAFAGAQITGVVLHHLSSSSGRTDVTTMLLAGIAINAMALAGTGALTYVATDEQLRSLTFWGMGSLGGATWSSLAVVAPVLVVAVASAWGLSRALDAMLLGEGEAHHLGVDVERTKRRALLTTSVLIGTSVALCGMIGFVGLLVPHLIRLVFGPSHRFLMTATILVGGVLLLIADLVARTVAAPAELPIGIVTALLGAPFFLALLKRQQT
jgi:iron complex transport system permease protein